jgi:hypothetical protein
MKIPKVFFTVADSVVRPILQTLNLMVSQPKFTNLALMLDYASRRCPTDH